jgi:hypothetical protein
MTASGQTLLSRLRVDWSAMGPQAEAYPSTVPPRRAKHPKPCQLPPEKIFCFSEIPNQTYIIPIPSRHEGRFAIVTNVRRGCGGRGGCAGRARPRRTVKSCGPGSPTLESSSRQGARATVANKPGHRGEYEAAVKTIARGMPGDSGVTCMLVCVFFNCFLHTRPRGASGARHSLRPQLGGQGILVANLGRMAWRDLESVFEIRTKRGDPRDRL